MRDAHEVMTWLTSVVAIVHEAFWVPHLPLHLYLQNAAYPHFVPQKTLLSHSKDEETEAQGGYLAQDRIAYKLPGL